MWQVKADSHIACRAHVAPLPCSDSAVSFVKVRVVARNIRTESNSLTDRLFCSVLLPLFTVVGMDRCEEDVIIACGLYLLVEEEKRKKNENTGFIRYSKHVKRKENFTLCLNV